MAELLVSVRCASEVEAALAGGAALIDVKEPTRGSLGRADDATIVQVVSAVAGRRPVSAALGELRETPTPFAADGLSFVKWGLAGCGDQAVWRRSLALAARQLEQTSPECRAVAVAYADWQRAAAPPPAAMVEFADEHNWSVLLFDTWLKDDTTLLDWLSVAEVNQLCGRCRHKGMRVALAGSLRAAQIRELRSAEPDWFAVRTAVCTGGQRANVICAESVRRLVAVVRAPA